MNLPARYPLAIGTLPGVNVNKVAGFCSVDIGKENPTRTVDGQRGAIDGRRARRQGANVSLIAKLRASEFADNLSAGTRGQGSPRIQVDGVDNEARAAVAIAASRPGAAATSNSAAGASTSRYQLIGESESGPPSLGVLGQALQERAESGDVGVDIVLSPRNRNDRAGPDDRLPNTAIGQPDTDDAAHEFVLSGVGLGGVARRFGSERVSRAREEVVDVPGETRRLDRFAHARRQALAQRGRVRVRLVDRDSRGLQVKSLGVGSPEIYI